MTDTARPGLTRRALGRARRLGRRLQNRASSEWKRRRRRVLVIGDSHVRVFDQPLLRRLPVTFDVTAVRGATASGLTNPNSQTGAGTAFVAKLESVAHLDRRPDAIVVMLGEVDCGFVIWWHHQEHGTPVGELLDQAVANLATLLTRARDVAPTTFISAPLPTIADAAQFGEQANLRRAITASQGERTSLVLDFNERVAALCRDIEIDFVDLDPHSLGPDGLVSPMLRDPDPSEHHYDQIVYARVLAKELSWRAPFG